MSTATTEDRKTHVTGRRSTRRRSRGLSPQGTNLSNTATPKYYGMFRNAVLAGNIPVNREVSLEMNRIDALIANPNIWYDEDAVEGWIRFCENELTLTDGTDLHLL